MFIPCRIEASCHTCSDARHQPSRFPWQAYRLRAEWPSESGPMAGHRQMAWGSVGRRTVPGPGTGLPLPRFRGTFDPRRFDGGAQGQIRRAKSR